MLQNVQIRSKVFSILVAPLLGLTILAAVGIGTSLARGVQAERVNDLSSLAVRLTALVHELQNERALSSSYVSARLSARAGQGQPIGADEMRAQRTVVDSAVKELKDVAAGLDIRDYNQRLQERLTRGLAQLHRLAAHRRGIDADQSGRLDADAVQAFYTNAISGLLDVNSEVAAGSNDEELIRKVTAFVALSRAKEATDLERAFLVRVLLAKGFAQGEFARFSALASERKVWLTQFRASATTEQLGIYNQHVRGGGLAAQADQIESRILRGRGGPEEIGGLQGGQGTVDQSLWFTAMEAKRDELRQVERDLASNIVTNSGSAKDAANRQALIYSVVLTIVLWLTVGLSLLMARSMVRPLVTLRDAAHEVAGRKLPGVVERLQRSGERVDLEAEAAAPIDIRSRDEIGQVAEAFNSVHSVAVQVAGEQAALRRSVGDMFLNLARRSQGLIDRQLELIDNLERNEADPDALDELFRLDHLATRMRRNAENLIVLSGAEPPRRWSEPVALIDIVRAAIAEVEDYTRIELLPIEDIGIVGQAVGDLVHLLAELVENATSFSPPETKVQIAGQPASSGYVLEIEDRGLGMTDAELLEANERLANPPVIDFALAQMLGFYVVGRLASRYGIKVQLRHSWYGGVTALVLLPASLIVRQAPLEVPSVTVPPIEAGRNAQRRPALAAPQRGPVGGRADHLPIFEAARSDWFETGPPSTGLPTHRPAEEPNGAPPGPVGVPDTEPPARVDGGQRQAPPVPPDEPGPDLGPPPAPEPRPAPRFTPQPPGPPEPPLVPPAPAPLRSFQPHPEPAPPPGLHDPLDVTSSGLPRRVPGANLAPGMSSAPAAPSPDEVESNASRSPDEVRSMLSSFRSGLERGRHEAAARDDEALIGSDAPSSAQER